MKRWMEAAMAAMMMAGGTAVWAAGGGDVAAAYAMLDRIGGKGAAEMIALELDTSLSEDGKEAFVLTAKDGKPMVKGNTMSALTAGVNWYLNHHAGINLTWNNPTADLSHRRVEHRRVGDNAPSQSEDNAPSQWDFTYGQAKASEAKVPSQWETHTSSADWRYYLNYCTFSYSMSPWTWERWEREIDWMALHGINLPLQIVGLEEVWRRMLTEDYGYSKEEVDEFVAGPAYMAWFGMNNLEGWGGPNPDWWYQRQAELGRKINDRMRELGITPVLPGFAGMVPSNFTEKTGIPAADQGQWCGFQRPFILDATSEEFAGVAANYYKRLHEVMGESTHYSIDPFHEGGVAPGDVDLAYRNLYKAMDAAAPGSTWVIQSWQWSPAQKKCLDNIPKGKLLVLDLFSDGRPNLGNYKGHDTVYSTIFNFGGRTGFFGRFDKVIDGYFDGIARHPEVVGIGAAPEAIEQTPVMYDLLFELPWTATKPDPEEWISSYPRRRYGVKSEKAEEAWRLLRKSALDCRSSLQGPHEATVCARPELSVERVSSWGGTEIFYEPDSLAKAAWLLLEANLEGENYEYDLVDIARQALTDRSQRILAEIKDAYERGDSAQFAAKRDLFLGLILDLDRLLGTNSNFMLGHWTEEARRVADEMENPTDEARDWLELDNARTLITTWGPEGPAEGLRDYSYREWNGLLRDFYYERWKRWFDGGMKEPVSGWFEFEWDWAHDGTRRYSEKAEGDAKEIAGELMEKYIHKL